jgi:hypothetical protein
MAAGNEEIFVVASLPLKHRSYNCNLPFARKEIHVVGST